MLDKFETAVIEDVLDIIDQELSSQKGHNRVVSTLLAIDYKLKQLVRTE